MLEEVTKTETHGQGSIDQIDSYVNITQKNRIHPAMINAKFSERSGVRLPIIIRCATYRELLEAVVTDGLLDITQLRSHSKPLLTRLWRRSDLAAFLNCSV